MKEWPHKSWSWISDLFITGDEWFGNIPSLNLDSNKTIVASGRLEYVSGINPAYVAWGHLVRNRRNGQEFLTSFWTDLLVCVRLSYKQVLTTSYKTSQSDI